VHKLSVEIPSAGKCQPLKNEERIVYIAKVDPHTEPRHSVDCILMIQKTREFRATRKCYRFKSSDCNVGMADLS